MNLRTTFDVCLWPALLASGLVLAWAPAAAQSRGATAGRASGEPLPVMTRAADGTTSVRATRLLQPLRVDGRLDDPAYSEVPPLTDFIQQEPDEGAPVSERTQAWILYDDTNVYVTCRCWDEHPERIVANDMRRDSPNLNQHDHFAVEFDTFHDRRNGFLFYASPAGGMRDMANTDGRTDINWNAVWDARTTRFDGGWILEMAIPFASLRYGQQETWGVQFRRFIPGKNERAHLTLLSPALGSGAINRIADGATLLGLRTPSALQRFEVKPYAITSVTTDRVSNPIRQNDVDPDAGVDVKYAVTKSFTADFSYNTDFAQVEEDEAQVNLTRFSLSFPEKREFFLEGQGIFQFGLGSGGGGSNGGGIAPTILYTRRIGLSSAGAVPVIAGGRLSGKAGPWSIGALTMETKADAAASVEQTNFTVLRVRRDILRRSAIGGILTRRSVSIAEPDGVNDVWGVDANFAFYENVAFSGYLAGSRTDGRSGDDLSYRTFFGYSADRYGLTLDRTVVEENFNPEVGFVRRRNFRQNYIQARFSPRTTSHPLVRKWTYQGTLENVTNNRNDLESREARAEFQMDFHSSDSFTTQYSRFHEFLPAPFEVSDGVILPLGGYSFDNFNMSYTAGQQHRFAGTASFDAGHFYSGSKRTVSLKGRAEITPQLGVEPNISLNWVDLPEGRFTTTVVGGRTTFTMTPRMFVAGLVQYDSDNTSVSTNLRFRWEYRPGSELFVVYSDGRSTLPIRGTELQNRGLVVKVNRLIRF